ncbi:cystathionine gamma-synthase [Truncatella angustata]|uniref:Cystathionine gamma-synthase n=1 Tax=Truncatella angustata TaxID=152316 RepID=A0A9P8UER0_9PEZI|nr:cystathionine gamma-synthase [Truncatella angustata]KAH6648601.1 cystathionine gamma-synthase [Truncatella angustata]
MTATIKTPFGHSLPPEGPHTVTLHAPKWESALRFREGDMTLFRQLKSLYPRFFPFGPSAMLLQHVSTKLQVPKGHGLVGFVSPDIWQTNREHAVSKFRRERALKEDEMKYHVIDIDGIRLYLVEYPSAKMMSAIFMWQHGGLGFSTRLGEYLLSKIDTLDYIGEFPDVTNPPEPTYLPEVESHELLRKRIAGLLMRGTVHNYPKSIQSQDVYLYQTGMAGITRFHEVAVQERPYPVAVFGAVFHSSWHLFEESPGGLKHYGKCNDHDITEFESYLEQGGKCSYVFTEFPSNPILVSVDLLRLRKLADKYGFWIAVDDTVGSFCNIDVLPVADVIITSLSKSMSGYADLLAGSVVLNPNKSSYEILKRTFTKTHHNELFSGDANQLLKNSEDYLPRSAILNRNAATLTAYFQSLAEDPKVPLTKVCYPPYADGSNNLLPFLRKPTPEFPQIGYGCLFSIEFDSLDHCIVFYNNLDFHQGPHLGAHLTITIPYNAMIYGKENPEYHASYGLNPTQIRFSVGLEDEEVLLERCKNAIATLEKSSALTKEGDDLANEVLQPIVERSANEKADMDPVGGKLVGGQ